MGRAIYNANMKNINWLLLVLLIALAAYLALWPVPIFPLAWHAPAAPGYTGVHAANSKLLGLQHIKLNGEAGPEHVLLGADGKLYAGMVSGHIVRMAPDGSGQQVFSATGGRPLGMAFDASDNLIVADADKGLLSIASDGAVTVLVEAWFGGELHFPNAVAVGRNGQIYVTDSSLSFTAGQWGGTLEAATLDILEHSCSGRVLAYDRALAALREIATGLCFANGIALSADENSLFVSESGMYRVWRVAAAAERLIVDVQSAQAQVVFDNLPGYPDNLTRGLHGRIWLGFAGQRNELDLMAQWPSLRSLALRIPRAFWSVPKPYGHVMAFTEDGKVVADLQDPSGASPITTGVTETAERLFIHSVDGKELGWLAR